MLRRSKIPRAAALAAVFFSVPLAANEALAGYSDKTPIYFDATLSGGIASGTLISWAPSSTLFDFDLGATLAYRLGNDSLALLLGATVDYSKQYQTSTTDPEIGNLAGHRLNPIAPTIGVDFGALIVKLDVQFLGSYSLDYSTAQGDNVSYGAPLGGRLTFLIPFADPVCIGGTVEMMKFGSQTSQTFGTVTESPPLKMTEYGVTIGIHF